MYTRYIPQPDGTYRRTRIPDPAPPHQAVRQEPQKERPESQFHPPEHQHKHEEKELECPPKPEPREQDCQPKPEPRQNQPRYSCSNSRPRQNRPCHRPPNRKENERNDNCDGKDNSVGGFLKQLLPKDFDTSDLLIVILLLLIAGDNSDEHNSALLTLALYLFM